MQVLSLKKGSFESFFGKSGSSSGSALSRPSGSAAKKANCSRGLASTPIDNLWLHVQLDGNRKQTSFPPLERILLPNPNPPPFVSSMPARCSSHCKLTFTVSLHFNYLSFSGPACIPFAKNVELHMMLK